MAEKVEKYKYKFDEDRSDLLIDLYRVKRKQKRYVIIVKMMRESILRIVFLMIFILMNGIILIF